MRTLFCLLLTLAFQLALGAAERLDYTVDARDRSDDRLTVTLTLPEALTEADEFRMPATVPGTYQIQDWGRMVASIRALDEAGQALSVPRSLSDNRWQLPAGTRSVVCELRDSFDAELGSREIWPMAGTNVEADNLVLNWFGFCGYVPGYQDRPLRVTVAADASWTAACAVPATTPEPGRWQWDFDSYDHLADCPAILGDLVVHRFAVDDCEILCAAFDTSGQRSSYTPAFLEDSFRPVVEATRDWLGSLPAERYAFLLHARRDAAFPIGALEHRTSSFYYCAPGLPTPLLQQIGAHEFFHIVTPLNLRSPLVDDFDYLDPQAPDHLWFYEGVTEYCSLLILRNAGLIDDRALCSLLAGKFATASRFRSDISLIELSRGCHDEHRDQYLNVYQRGALVAMALDLEMRRLTAGETGLREVILALLADYGPDRPFAADELFTRIAGHSHPDIADWLETHVADTERPDYVRLLSQAGFELSQAENRDGDVYVRGLRPAADPTREQRAFRSRWLEPVASIETQPVEP